MYYFRMMEPDFTPLPVWTAVADYAPDPPPVTPPPSWRYVWRQLRPTFFLVGAALFLFSLLLWLAPEDDGYGV
jgi:hypothetical protein